MSWCPGFLEILQLQQIQSEKNVFIFLLPFKIFISDVSLCSTLLTHPTHPLSPLSVAFSLSAASKVLHNDDVLGLCVR